MAETPGRVEAKNQMRDMWTGEIDDSVQSVHRILEPDLQEHPHAAPKSEASLTSQFSG